MMIPYDMSGSFLIQLLCKEWEYVFVHRVGSHVLLQTETPSQHRIIVPDHHVMKPWAFHAILRSVAAHKRVSRATILTTETNP